MTTESEEKTDRGALVSARQRSGEVPPNRLCGQCGGDVDAPGHDHRRDRAQGLAGHLESLVWRLKAYTAGAGMLPAHVPDDLWEAMRSTAASLSSGGEEPMPGEIVQRWRDELEALSREIGKHLDDIKYGPPPSSSSTQEKP